jgi:hypothetical protein
MKAEQHYCYSIKTPEVINGILEYTSFVFSGSKGSMKIK